MSDPGQMVAADHVLAVLRDIEEGYKRGIAALEKRLERCEYDSEREVLRRRVAELERIVDSYKDGTDAR